MASEDKGALKTAAAENNMAEVKRLIETANVSVDQPDEFGDTALHAACQNGRNDIAKYLLSKGANPNVRNNVGSTPLHKLLASKYEQKAILKALLKANADPNIRSGAGKLPEEFVRNQGILKELLGDLMITEEVDVPKNLHGRVIGKGGQKRSEIRDETHCIITVPEQGQASTVITVVGRQENVTRAKAMIKAAISDRKADDEEGDADGLTTVRYPLAKNLHKQVIGAGGKTINRIRDETNVQIFVPKADSPDNTLLLKGESDDISEAIKLINEVTRPRPQGQGQGRGRGGYNNTERRNSDNRDRRGNNNNDDRRGSSDNNQKEKGDNDNANNKRVNNVDNSNNRRSSSDNAAPITTTTTRGGKAVLNLDFTFSDNRGRQQPRAKAYNNNNNNNNEISTPPPTTTDDTTNDTANDTAAATTTSDSDDQE